MPDNEKTDNYEDVYRLRTLTFPFADLSVAASGLLVNNLGQRRADSNNGKSLFKDFIPAIGVYNTRGEGSKKGSAVFYTHRVIFKNIQESSAETAQVSKTFSPKIDGKDIHLSFYGENPRIYQFSGVLLHTMANGRGNPAASSVNSGITPDSINDANWYDSFKYAYENLLKGSKCAELGFQVRVSYDWRWSQGYLLNFSSNISATNLGEIPFTFSMLVSKAGTYHTGGEISSKKVVDAALATTNQERVNNGVFMETSDGDPQFMYNTD